MAPKGEGMAPAVSEEHAGTRPRKAGATRMLAESDVAKVGEKLGLTLIVIDGKVYDVTEWVRKHPGGDLPLTMLKGKDATDIFFAYHPEWVRKRMLPSMEFATVKDPMPLSAATRDFRCLTRQMIEDGMFETNYWYYAAKLFVIFGMLAASVAIILKATSTVHYVVAAALMGLYFQQLAFVGHDTGHQGITHNRTVDSWIGLFVGNFATGLSIGWWKRNHNVHHIVTNSMDFDPDIQHLPIFAIAPEFLQRPIFSVFYNRFLSLSNLAHLLCRQQQHLYYPVMAVARINLYAQSTLHALGVGPYKTDNLWKPRWQLGALVAYWVWYSILLAQLPSWRIRLMFFLLSNAVAGILHVQITLSHFAMPTYFGVPYGDEKSTFLQTQLRTSMDVDSNILTDWFHGGLQYQVEHHLWPRLPRHNLGKSRALLADLCVRHGLTLASYGFVKANKIMIGRLEETSRHAKSFSHFFWEAINAFG